MSIIRRTDSYKLGHYLMLVDGVENASSYFESRENTFSEKTLWFGLQYYLKKMGKVLQQDVEEVEEEVEDHLGPGIFNRKGWEKIINVYNGDLPITIRSLPEGSYVKSSIPLLDITLTEDDKELAWLPQYIESYLMHVWLPSAVATLSFNTKVDIANYWLQTCDNLNGLEFALHDFGYRAVGDDDAAAIAGLGHLVNFRGTDTFPAIKLGKKMYDMRKDHALSVFASEHSIMTQLGKGGEEEVFLHLLNTIPKDKLLSVVIDSYCPYNFISNIVRKHADKVLERTAPTVFRPDSTTGRHPKPADQVVWIQKELMDIFGYHTTNKGFDELNSKLGNLWGDGIDRPGVNEILRAVVANGISVRSNVFGMGGGLLQKINRDNLRFALKKSAQKMNGKWMDIKKETYGKTSRSGRFSVEEINGEFSVMQLGHSLNDMLKVVYRNGVIFEENFETICNRAAGYFKKELM